MNERPLIFIIDDESRIRRLIAENLESLGFDVMTAADGEFALEIYRKSPAQPDLVLLDIMMPGMDGFECASKLREITPNLPIVFLSARNEPHFKLQGFNSGADDYITKPFLIDELVARIRAVLRRSHPEPVAADTEQRLKNGPLCLSTTQHKFWVNDTEVHLADTEFRLLHILMKNPGTVIPHTHLLAQVWGPEYTDEFQYLRVNFARIRRKIEEAGLKDFVISSYAKVGYILRNFDTDPE